MKVSAEKASKAQYNQDNHGRLCEVFAPSTVWQPVSEKAPVHNAKKPIIREYGWVWCE